MQKAIKVKASIKGGKIEVPASIGATVVRVVGPSIYKGATAVTPSHIEQVLPTTDKLVRDDITVYPAPTEYLSTDHNGTFVPSSGKVGFYQVDVDVQPELTSLSCTENGLYLPETGVDGFNRVNVNVPPTIPDLVPLTATANGQYVPTGHDGYSEVNVNVPDHYLVKQWTEESENLAFCSYWSDKIADRDESAYIYIMKFYNNTHANGVQLLLYGAREDTKVIGIRYNTYRIIETNYSDTNIYALYTSAGTIVKVYRIPKTT